MDSGGATALAAAAGPPAELVVDPTVSRAKFDREVASCRRLQDDLRRRGWWLLETEFPKVLVAFAHPKLRPPAVVFGAEMDFTNYDLWAPSVRIVNPFTREAYKARELPMPPLRRRVPSQLPPQFAALGLPGLQQIEEVPLLQFNDPDEVPFLCLPGVREYHEHPGHTGDSWLLHRGRGEGTLYFLLEQLHKYGVEPLRGFSIGMQITGFAPAEAPE